jgi:hypothetical protein
VEIDLVHLRLDEGGLHIDLLAARARRDVDGPIATER